MKRLMIRLDEGDYSRLEKRAVESGEPPAVLVRRFVRQALGIERTPERQREVHKAFTELRDWARRSDTQFDPVAVVKAGRQERP